VDLDFTGDVVLGRGAEDFLDVDLISGPALELSLRVMWPMLVVYELVIARAAGRSVSLGPV
jgi:hypothetical protein